MFSRRVAISISTVAAAWTCLAAEPGSQGEAAGAVLEACISSANTGAPVETGALTIYFKSNRAGTSLTANTGLPKVKLDISNEGTFRCVVSGKGAVKDSEFAKVLVERLKAWPGIELKTLKDGTESYILRPDPEKNLLGTAVTVELAYGDVWTVMVWGTARSPAPK